MVVWIVWHNKQILVDELFDTVRENGFTNSSTYWAGAYWHKDSYNLCFIVDICHIDVFYVSCVETVIVLWRHYGQYSAMMSFMRCWRSFRVQSFTRFHNVILMFDMKLLSCVHILFVVSPYPVDLVGHPSGRNKAMQQYLVVESLCVPQTLCQLMVQKVAQVIKV